MGQQRDKHTDERKRVDRWAAEDGTQVTNNAAIISRALLPNHPRLSLGERRDRRMFQMQRPSPFLAMACTATEK
jgi:hypothetical protein